MVPNPTVFRVLGVNPKPKTHGRRKQLTVLERTRQRLQRLTVTHPAHDILNLETM